MIVAVKQNEMDNALKTLINSAPNFDTNLVKYVDSCTINRDNGFDMYSWSYWGMCQNTYNSICACVTDTYTLYKRFRKLQDNFN